MSPKVLAHMPERVALGGTVFDRSVSGIRRMGHARETEPVEAVQHDAIGGGFNLTMTDDTQIVLSGER